MRWTVMDSQKDGPSRVSSRIEGSTGEPCWGKTITPEASESLILKKPDTGRVNGGESFGKELQKQGVPGNLLFYCNIGDYTTLLFYTNHLYLPLGGCFIQILRIITWKLKEIITTWSGSWWLNYQQLMYLEDCENYAVEPVDLGGCFLKRKRFRYAFGFTD